MQYHFQTAGITLPTVDSFHEYAVMRWQSLERLARGSARLRANLQKIGSHQFELRVELVVSGEHYFARVVADTITELVDKVNKKLRRQMVGKRMR